VASPAARPEDPVAVVRSVVPVAAPAAPVVPVAAPAAAPAAVATNKNKFWPLSSRAKFMYIIMQKFSIVNPIESLIRQPLLFFPIFLAFQKIMLKNL
jgi:hypothetical protein